MFKEYNEIFINPQYADLTTFIEGLPLNFSHDGHLIRHERNSVKWFNIEEHLINVKEFCIPSFILNRIIYCYFRKPKAVRAYENAIKLNEVGIESPTPIAYILCKRGGILLKSYFISEQYSYEESITDLESSDLDERSTVIFSAFGTFTAYLHNLGMLHCDYGNGNILINYNGIKPSFILIDTNRMRFGTVSMMMGCKDFNRLELSAEKISLISHTYAKGRGFDESQVFQNIHRFQIEHKRIKRLKLLKTLIMRQRQKANNIY